MNKFWEYPYLEYKYVQMAAHYGDVDAMRVLSIMKLEGIGCYEDMEESAYWTRMYEETKKLEQDNEN